MKVVSLVPSFTYTLLDTGFPAENILARTKFCTEPAALVTSIPRIGGTKNLHLQRIRELKPDLLIASKEENTLEDITALQEEIPVWLTDIKTLADNDEFLSTLEEKLDYTFNAKKVSESIYATLNAHRLPQKKKAAYLIWKNPWMSIGNDTFIHSVLDYLGWENIMGSHTRYPEITESQLREADTLLLSSEPFPFDSSHLKALKKSFPDKEIIRVDGAFFSWYGSYLRHNHNYLLERG